MKRAILTDDFSVAPQLQPGDIRDLPSLGVRSIICNRPDNESAGQPTFAEVAKTAASANLDFHYLPVVIENITAADVESFARLLQELPKPILAYCRSGTRSAKLWALAQKQMAVPSAYIINAAKTAGYDVQATIAAWEITQQRNADTFTEKPKGEQKPTKTVAKLTQPPNNPPQKPDISASQNHRNSTAMVAEQRFDVVIVGGGSAGIATCASLLKRRADLSIAIVDPADVHYYQPGWTMVGGGIFDAKNTVKPLASLIPHGVHLVKTRVIGFEPDKNQIIVENNSPLTYKRLVVTPGLSLNWQAIEGLEETLGKNGVTSNYRFDLAPYTWRLVRELRQGRALFTQPPMPIKCAGAPQKAMYLSADHWFKGDVLKDIQVEFYNAGPGLFGVKEYVPALMEYIKKYHVSLKFSHNLRKINGPAKTAWFDKIDADGNKETVVAQFDMIHVCPPQSAPQFIQSSPLADSVGWVDVDQATLRHKTYANIWSLGDVCNAPNAKTMAAARKQAPVVANNIVADITGNTSLAHYDGYGSCPLTVERGKIVLAEFGYGGKLLPSFPLWLIDGTQPSRTAWLLKEKLLPPIYWHAMLKGREWLARPQTANSEYE